MEQVRIENTGILPRESHENHLADIIPKNLFDENLREHRPPLVTISKPINFVFAFLSDVTNYPDFMKQWAGGNVVEHKQHQLIVWVSTNGNNGKFVGAFALEKLPENRGTVVALKVGPETSTGKLANQFSKLALKDLNSKAYTDLRRLKALLETGEVPTIEGQPSGRAEDMPEDQRVSH